MPVSKKQKMQYFNNQEKRLEIGASYTCYKQKLISNLTIDAAQKLSLPQLFRGKGSAKQGERRPATEKAVDG